MVPNYQTAYYTWRTLVLYPSYTPDIQTQWGKKPSETPLTWVRRQTSAGCLRLYDPFWMIFIIIIINIKYVQIDIYIYTVYIYTVHIYIYCIYIYTVYIYKTYIYTPGVSKKSGGCWRLKVYIYIYTDMHPYESKLNTIPMAPTGHEDRSVQHFQDGRAGRFLRNVRPAGER